MRKAVVAVVIVALAVAVVMLASGGGTDKHEGAIQALRQQMDWLSAGDTGRLYDSLHPAQQALIAEGSFEDCFRDLTSTMSASVGAVRMTSEEVTTIPGTDVAVTVVAVTVELTAEVDGQRRAGVATYFEVEVDGEWKWALPDVEDCADH